MSPLVPWLAALLIAGFWPATAAAQPLAASRCWSPVPVSVSVEAAAAVVDHTKTGVSQGDPGVAILNLPINSRRADSHVLLTPAVVPDGVLGLVAFRGIAGGNAFLTDGNDTSNQFFHENAGRTRIPTQISQDAVQEYQVLSSGYSAEYGRAFMGSAVANAA